MNESPSLYPAFLNLQGCRTVVIGSGPVGRRKMLGLLSAGAKVNVVSLEPVPMLYRDQVQWRHGAYTESDLHGCIYAIAAATPEVNRQIVADAKARGMLINTSSESEVGNVIIPAVYRNGPIHVTVSTQGASPRLARMIRDEIGSRINPLFPEWANLLAEYRQLLRSRIAHTVTRIELFRELSDPRWFKELQEHGTRHVRRAYDLLVENASGR